MGQFEKTVKLARKKQDTPVSSKEIKAAIASLRDQRNQIDAQIIKFEHELLDALEVEEAALAEENDAQSGGGARTLSPAQTRKFREDFMSTIVAMRKEKQRGGGSAMQEDTYDVSPRNGEEKDKEKEKRKSRERKRKEKRTSGGGGAGGTTAWQTIKLTPNAMLDVKEDGWMISPRHNKDKNRLTPPPATITTEREKEKEDHYNKLKKEREDKEKEKEKKEKEEKERKDQEDKEWLAVKLSETTTLNVMDDGWMQERKKDNNHHINSDNKKTERKPAQLQVTVEEPPSGMATKNDKNVQGEKTQQQQKEKEKEKEKEKGKEEKKGQEGESGVGVEVLRLTESTIFDVHDDGWLLPRENSRILSARRRRSASVAARPTLLAPPLIAGDLESLNLDSRRSSEPTNELLSPTSSRKKHRLALDDSALDGLRLSSEETPVIRPGYQTLGRAADRLHAIGKPRRALDASEYPVPPLPHIGVSFFVYFDSP